jgi:branched-chain amino acid transport system substrate-binding protein
MIYEHRQIVEQLGIDIERFFQDLEATPERQLLSERDKEMIGRFLLGYRRKQIADAINLSDAEVGNRLSSNIYPKIVQLMQVEKADVANNWTLILNFLLNPETGYRLNPPPQLNSDNFQASCGRQVFLHPSQPIVAQAQLEATHRYQQGYYYQALLFFAKAWSLERQMGRGNPEICIYINNCLIEAQKAFLQQRGIKVYTLAVVVPFHHNQGAIAAEILRGVAQIQSIVNFQHFDAAGLDTEFLTASNGLFSICQSSDRLSFGRIALRIMVVNDPNNVYAPYNQTAEKLANLADELDIVAVIGHYSSEMTQTALNFYTEKGIVLVNASSTSNQLSHLDDDIGFYRVTTQDEINAADLVEYLAESLVDRHSKTIAIIYNENSSYSCSYRDSVKQSLDQYSNQFELHSEYGQLGGDVYHLQRYLQKIQEEVDAIVLIPDGGIEPNSLNNIGLISRVSLNRCLIAGSATLYHENLLHWMQERHQTAETLQRLVACIPWHWDSRQNGCESANPLAQAFCKLGAALWGEGNLTWRSATAFDSVLTILKALERHSEQEKLIVEMRKFFKVQGKGVQGVTGIIKFHSNGDRISPPTEIVTIAPDPASARWRWKHLKSMH